MAVGVLTASDKGSRGERKDESGPLIRELVRRIGGEVKRYEILPDQKEALADKLRAWADQDRLDLIFTTGGTGFSPRDFTPEATLAVCDRLAPGIAEAIRAEGLKKTPRAMLSRAVAGIRGRTLIINLPGSVKGVRESLEAILPALPHAVEVLRGEARDCGHEVKAQSRRQSGRAGRGRQRKGDRP
ncbi:MAG: molybdenum cofactor biosynthesis protein [Deltaproteobacteria bacterium RBG_13_61_14]|nr:MAG: molybdenum cofactor biosynthesis protein [Deltaproteobacteria bacterium RBG_13_61_14]